jgi:hypothetical protein
MILGLGLERDAYHCIPRGTRCRANNIVWPFWLETMSLLFCFLVVLHTYIAH